MARMPPGVDLHFTTANDERRYGQGGGAGVSGTVAGEGVTLSRVSINSPIASAILTIYKGPYTTQSPSSNGTKVATILCSGTIPTTLEYHLRCPNGLYAQLTGGNADVTIVIDGG